MYSQTFTGIIIKITNFQEADKIVTVFSKELGKAQFIAKGVRKVKSKSSGLVDLFVDGIYEVTNKEQLPTLIQAQLNTWFPYLRTSLQHWQYAERAAKALLKATKEHDPHPELYFLFKDFLLNGNNAFNPQLWWLQFLWQLLFISGFGINLSHCINCGAELSDKIIGNKSANFEGFRCNECALKIEEPDKTIYQTLVILNQGMIQDSIHSTSSGQEFKIQNESVFNLSLVQDFLENAFKYHFM